MKSPASLFRRQAVERFNAAIEADTPDLLIPWRPALAWVGAAAILLAVAVWPGG